MIFFLCFSFLPKSYAEDYLIIDFMAPWCVPCKQMEADAWADQEVKAYLTGDKHVDFKKIDVDAKPVLAKDYNITKVPTIVITKWNTETKKWEEIERIGYSRPKPLLEFFRKIIHPGLKLKTFAVNESFL